MVEEHLIDQRGIFIMRSFFYQEIVSTSLILNGFLLVSIKEKKKPKPRNILECCKQLFVSGKTALPLFFLCWTV